MATINGYLNNLPDKKTRDGRTLRDIMADTVSIWSNDSCKGYAIIAMREAGLDDQTIANVVRAFRFAFDDNSVEMAEQIYYEYTGQ